MTALFQTENSGVMGRGRIYLCPLLTKLGKLGYGYSMQLDRLELRLTSMSHHLVRAAPSSVDL